MKCRILSALVLLLALPAWAAEEEPVATDQPAPPAITVSEITRMILRDRVIAGGLVGAVEQVTVQPLVEGQPIETLEADVGDHVEAGQVLARLSTAALELQKSQLRAGLASARATVAQAEAQVVEARASADEAQRVAERNRALREQGNTSQAAYDQARAAAASAAARVTVARQTLEAAQAQVDLAKAQLADVELNLKRTNVVAPVAGEVLTRNAQVGAVASAAGEPMFVLMKNGALELRAEISEADLLRLKPGMPALIRNVGGQTPIAGTLRLVEPGISATTRLGIARISIDDPDALRSGMYADAEIILAEREGLAVPVTAVGSNADGEPVVMQVEDSVVHEVTVETGIRDAGMVEVATGLAEGDRVVTKAAAFVREGDRVSAVLAGGQ
ncbi:efflux RND transporter periplasmic adaptor subunit [Paracoccus alkanivorans]|uniref:Efflux RND transporter periplasmic adaptor subunit n=1 Tax=Paracoccus alkanivorans TaxID=2116655 RepID=A0A3M0ME70_9RHOB|nr:efflux RND transporter periplasmic adaptor subunit [Paracoccus alkanivorans]RMC35655.1 efflux RND transporter periplasmic adaptor subunit [Paracoccus alkanivorans]